METDQADPSPSKAALWTGWVLAAIITAMMLMSAVMKFQLGEEATKGFEHLGWPITAATKLGIIELVATILFAIPQTAVLGAILLTGYLGGAIATHVRIEEDFLIPVVLGVLVWLSLYLRDPRLRKLLPLR